MNFKLLQINTVEDGRRGRNHNYSPLSPGRLSSIISAGEKTIINYQSMSFMSLLTESAPAVVSQTPERKHFVRHKPAIHLNLTVIES